MLISTITSNIPFIQLSLMHRITEKICKERWQHWCTKISGVKVLPTLLISTITSNMSFIQLSLMLSGYPASSSLDISTNVKVCMYVFIFVTLGTLIEVHPIVSRKLQGVPFVGERLLWLCCSVRHVLLSTSARQDLRARVMKSDNFLGKLVRSKKQQPSVF